MFRLMDDNETNPYRLGTKVDSTSPKKSYRDNGLGYFFLAASIFIIASVTTDYFPQTSHFRILAALTSLVLSCAGFFHSMSQWDDVVVRAAWPTFLNFISFGLNAMWSMFILYTLVTFFWFWIISL